MNNRNIHCQKVKVARCSQWVCGKVAERANLCRQRCNWGGWGGMSSSSSPPLPSLFLKWTRNHFPRGEQRELLNALAHARYVLNPQSWQTLYITTQPQPHPRITCYRIYNNSWDCLRQVGSDAFCDSTIYRIAWMMIRWYLMVVSVYQMVALQEASWPVLVLYLWVVISINTSTAGSTVTGVSAISVSSDTY